MATSGDEPQRRRMKLRLFDTIVPEGDPRLRVDAVASEAAAWSVEEMVQMLAESGLSEMRHSRDRIVGIYQAWWISGRRPATAPA